MILDKAKYYYKLNKIIVNSPGAINSARVFLILSILILLFLLYLLWRHINHYMPKKDYIHKLGTVVELLVICVVFSFMCISWCNYNEVRHNYINAKFDKELVVHNQPSSELAPTSKFYNFSRF